ncbi:MAG: bifunctional riboflavin kinase/FAD synthetase [Panacagrimonas sp.]
MELIRNLLKLRPQPPRGYAVTVGKFDGVHLGHQALLAAMRDQAGRLGLPTTVLSFDPSPRDFFCPNEALPRVSTLRDKLAALSRYGVDRLILARFDESIACIPPQEFIEEILVKRIGARAVIVGDDTRFGRKRAGDIHLIQSMASQMGYVAAAVGTVCIDGERCSSSAVREALSAGDFKRAERLLGRPYVISGPVRRGLQLGRKLDMPTANIPVQKRLALPLGVYAVIGRCEGKTWNGVASLGVRPTLGLTRCLLETHLFGTPGDLYGRLLEVEFRSYLRPELKFDSIGTLKQQMHEDAAEAQRRLGA